MLSNLQTQRSENEQKQSHKKENFTYQSPLDAQDLDCHSESWHRPVLSLQFPSCVHWTDCRSHPPLVFRHSGYPHRVCQATTCITYLTLMLPFTNYVSSVSRYQLLQTTKIENKNAADFLIYGQIHTQIAFLKLQQTVTFEQWALVQLNTITHT